MTEAAIVGNLYAHNAQRNPCFKSGSSGVVVNNLIYGPGSRAVHYALRAEEWGSRPFETGRLAVVGNVLKVGPDSERDLPFVRIDGEGPVAICVLDNLVLDVDGRVIAQATILRDILGLGARVAEPPVWPAGLAPAPARDVLDGVLSRAGARPWDRDELDRRIVQQAREGTGRIIDGEGEVGGYPRTGPTRRAFREEEWDLSTMERK